MNDTNKQPNYNIYFDRDNIKDALVCMNEYGYCVIRKMIGLKLVEELKYSIDEIMDPARDLPQASNRYHVQFAEESKPLWKLMNHAPYLNYLSQVHQTNNLCLHRSAAILRTAGESCGTWHTDWRGHIKEPRTPNDILNRYSLPSGNWFYLNGSHPDYSGIAVIEKSHIKDWKGPEGFEFNPNKTSFHPTGDFIENGYKKMDVPGCIEVIADPGDLICFAPLTWHTNMATEERRYSCGIGFRPKSIKIKAPWPLPITAQRMIERLPKHLKSYANGYTGIDVQWRANPRIALPKNGKNDTF